MFAVVGTIPEKDFHLVSGKVILETNAIRVNERRIPVNRGTAALLAAAIKTCEVLDFPLPHGYLVGDIGLGDGSRRLYKYLAEDIPRNGFPVITFHYLQPDVDWHNKVLFAVEEMSTPPLLTHVFRSRVSREKFVCNLKPQTSNFKHKKGER